jgi:hypothetical protein
VTAPRSATAGPVTAAQLTIVPANQASWAKEITWGELHVGSRQVFADAGFTEVSHPSPRRVVMRADFAQRAARPRSRVSTARRA